MTMQSPEIMLTELNSALRRLRGACSELADEYIDEKLLAVMRRLLLAEVLGNTWIVAIGGSQGAGKTTLMSSMYGLRGNGPCWLQSNPGRGEKMPVLIIEIEGLKEPQGYVRRLQKDEASKGYTLREVKIDVNEFQRAVRDPNAEDLLPVLKVPQRFFKRQNQAWLLLPGYEKQERANRSWQELMRQAMIAAGGCIIVTDKTRMANQQQQEIVRDMLENELRGCSPYIVISQTEAYRHNPERLAELRASAQATFKVPDERAETNIICSGTDDVDYVNEWMPQLHRAIEDLNSTGQSDRIFQMSHLSKIVGADLGPVLAAIRSKALLYYRRGKSGYSDGADVLEEVLEAFDEAAILLREEHLGKVNELTGKAYGDAAKALDKTLASDHEGLKNRLFTAFDSTTETKQKMQSLVQDSWKKAAPGLFTSYPKVLEALTAQKLGRLSEADSPDSAHAPERLGNAHKLVQLGYIHTSGRPVRFSNLNAANVSDIKILLGNSSKALEPAAQELSKNFTNSVGLIPAMTLEYSRILYTLPELVGLKDDFTPLNGSTDANMAVEGVESLSAGVELGRTAIRSLAGIMAVDVISDGDTDILGALFGRSQTEDGEPDASTGGGGIPAIPVTLHPVATAAVAVVAVGYMTTTAITRVRTFEKAASAQAHNMLRNIHNHHVAHFRAHFDKLMTAAKTRITENVRARYHMDETLMRKDRLAKAIADVNAITSDLRHELETSAAGLQLFTTERGK